MGAGPSSQLRLGQGGMALEAKPGSLQWAYFLFGEIIMNSRIIDIAKYCLGAQVRGSRGEKSLCAWQRVVFANYLYTICTTRHTTGDNNDGDGE